MKTKGHVSGLIVTFFLIGVIVRTLPVIRSPYLLGEGGLFYWIIDFIASHGKLPVTIPYYSCGVPYAYPPLGFIFYALIYKITGFPLFSIMRWSAVVFSVLSLGAFWGLAREFLNGRALDFAVLSFATLPSVAWCITVSDSIRNFAFFMSLCSICLFYKALRAKGSYFWSFLSGLLLGLTVMTHLSVGVSLTTTVVLFALYWYARHKENRVRNVLGPFLITLIVALAVSTPWIAYLHHYYGTGFISLMERAFHSRPHKSIWLLSILRLGNTGEPYGSVWGVLGYLGLVYSAFYYELLLPLWFVVLPIHWFKQVYAVPLALGAGIALTRLVLDNFKDSTAKIFVSALVILYVTLSASISSVMRSDPLLVRRIAGHSTEYQVSPSRLDAWRWMREHISGSRVVVVGNDKEWVPAFAHVCVNIPQGAEWIGKFLSQGEMYNKIAKVADYDQLSSVLKEYKQKVDYVYVSGIPSREFFLKSITKSGCAEEVFLNDNTAVFDVRYCK